ncbi:MAG: hypothetical protein MSS96_05615 [Bacteroidales bacterium]|nr:hypothetical protein [Bacteroidales bacterium]
MKKIYLQPSLRIRELDKCLLAGSTGTVQGGGGKDGGEVRSAEAKQQSFSEDEEYSPSSVNIWE